MKSDPVAGAGHLAAPDQSEVAPSKRSARPCAICGKPVRAEHRPFCSARCADIDLNRWLGGVYVIPATSEPDEEAD
ncbi:DNA gyrase inhibitor YacG [Chelatococcus reniformis]|uniref:DNA gyrase inhibitor YacG n=1 Tax=Chelatococcus reniformis TaxID=1494448 RepID=A0A916XII1_9HYPH|nr:DNA gyrase inhibitor YacG [Chelatococcus reniformis]GGC72955.1 hypothetical protein GCM10010994_34170 [Chelatococcus reniformis]